jgi:hypothetical protein
MLLCNQTYAGLDVQIAWLMEGERAFTEMVEESRNRFLSQGNETERTSHAVTVVKKRTPAQTFSCMSLTDCKPKHKVSLFQTSVRHVVF